MCGVGCECEGQRLGFCSKGCKDVVNGGLTDVKFFTCREGGLTVESFHGLNLGSKSDLSI